MSNPKELSEWLVHTTDETFELDVIQRSQSGLVVLDFWAEWCAPCRQLGPVLEKLASEYAGRFTLVKADTEVNQAAAGQFAVTGIPAVFALVDGQVVDSFQGVLPEEAIRQWLDALLQKDELAAALRLSKEAPEAAEAKLREILQQSPQEAAASLALAELLLRQERDEECREIIDRLEQRGFLEPQGERIKAGLDLRGKAGMDLAAVQAAAEAAPDDFALQFAWAEALAGAKQYQAACELCLTLVARDRQQTGEQARELMIEIFRVLPDDSELTSEYRRKLSAALY